MVGVKETDFGIERERRVCVCVCARACGGDARERECEKCDVGGEAVRVRFAAC
ncbi:uncharacterized protein G2W53_034363 [Senna tora]|uniref:Uncharacterized protein n=1 Tax=Senna tora TaxID=362788 RepID=A0A834T1R0_9FABA|nr:uncharacterized protein G2W53_034363 [Senna tora]